MTIFCLYTCKQGSDESIYRKAKHIASLCTSNKFMVPDRFCDVVKKICELASTKFMKAIVQTSYIEDFYNKADYENL